MQSLRSVSSVVPGGSTKVASNLTDSGPVLADIASVVSYHYKNWSAWMEFFGQIGKQSNKNDKLGYSYNAYGPAFGMDTRLSDNAIIGLSTGYVHTNADTNGIDSSTNVNAFNLTAYGTYYETKEYYLDAAFTYGWNWYDSKRAITGLGYATSDHEGYELSVYGGGGYYLDDLIGWDWISIIPIASVQYMHHGEDSFSETANNTPFMNIDSIESDSLISRFGLCLEHLFKIKFKTKTVDVLTNVSGQWGHEYLDTKNTVPAQFAQSTASAFDTDGVEADRDSFLFGAGFVASVTENLDLFFDYNMDLRDTFHAHNFAIRARFKW
jgi:outer membrane autotransporter protein